MNDVVHALLTLDVVTGDALEPWWNATRDAREAAATPADRALIGGVLADRLGFAFATGYQEALRTLVGTDDVSALCVTEARGNTPKDIDTTLTPAGDDFELAGTKKWATAAPLARHLLVCAKIGVDAHGRNALRMVRVATTAPGVTLTASSAPFVPEIPHARVTLDRVAVASADVLPGDGYADYVKPFRTIEDAHVHAALVGYLIGVARRHDLPRALVEQLAACALAIRELATSDARSPARHIALAGAIADVTRLVGELERPWGERGGDEHARWLRDRPLLGVAGAARAARLAAAWTAVNS